MTSSLTEASPAEASVSSVFVSVITGFFERDNLVRLGWRSEGVTGYMFKTQVAGTAPLYRLYNPANGAHLFTMSSGEQIFLTSRLGYRDEGAAGYMAATPSEI